MIDDNRVRLKVLGLSKGTMHENMYILLLQEWGGERKIPIIIGQMEAQAIALKTRHVPLERPMVQDLFKRLTDAFNITLKDIYIYKVDNGVYYSYLELEQDGIETDIDARSSDAIALALTYGCPIYTSETLMRSQYMRVNGSALSIPINTLDVQALREALDRAVKDENYELASLLRDEINKRLHPQSVSSDDASVKSDQLSTEER